MAKNTRFVDALFGYEYYLKNRGEISLDDINDYLMEQFRRPISLRTYSHYRTLVKYGFESYIPINKFDVFRSLGKIQIASDRRKYKRERKDEEISITVDGVNYFNGIIIDESLVSLGIKLESNILAVPGELISIKRSGYKTLPAFLVWKSKIENNIRIGVRVLQYISNYQLDQIEIDTEYLGTIKIIGNIDGSFYWYRMIIILERTNEFLVSLISLVETISNYTGIKPITKNPILGSIHFESPGTAEIKTDLGLAELAEVVINAFQDRKLKKRKLEAEVEKAELENDLIKIERARKAVQFVKDLQDSKIPSDLIPNIKHFLEKELGLDDLPETLFSKGSLEKGILEERIAPAITDILAGDDADFDITAEKK